MRRTSKELYQAKKLLKTDQAKEVCSKVISKLRPSLKERNCLRKIIKKFIAKTNKQLKKYSANAVLGGSGAKGTWISGEFDADVFVLFDYKKYSEKESAIASILGKALKKEFKGVKTLHGSRDYYQVIEKESKCTGKKYKGSGSREFTFEIVPILNIKSAEQAKNITDISPLHTKWVIEQVKHFRKRHSKIHSELKAKKKRSAKNKSKLFKQKHVGGKNLADEILLTKAFCKAAGVYGAESYINGLSGYACEVLTIQYGSFAELAFNAAEGWSRPAGEKVIIDPEEHWATKSVELELNASKITGPLILVDPVQASRNVTAAVSQEKFDLFRDKCHEFLRHPSEEFFTKKEMDAHEVKELLKLYPNGKLMSVAVIARPGREDAIGCSMLKLFNLITTELEKNEFKIYYKNWAYDKTVNAKMYFIVEKTELKKMRLHTGPLLTMTKHIEEFRKKHAVTFEQDGRMCAEIERKFTNAEMLIEHILNTAVKENKAKSIRTL